MSWRHAGRADRRPRSADRGWDTGLQVSNQRNHTSTTLFIQSIAGQEFYAVIPEIWGGMQPIYLPAMWLPFVPAAIFDFDPRFIPLTFMFGGLGLLILVNSSRKVFSEEFYVLIPASLLIISLLVVHSNFISMSQEGVVVAYYLLLAVALSQDRPWLLGLALSLCLMSRYGLIFWAIMYALYAWNTQGKKWTLSTGMYTLLFSLLLLLIGRTIPSLGILLEVPSNYVNDIQNLRTKYEPLIETSLGLAKFVSYENLASFHKLFIALSLLIPFMIYSYVSIRKSKLNMAFFGLCSLKLTLVFFYNFLIMPYLYLFYTSTFISIAIYVFYTREENAAKVISSS